MYIDYKCTKINLKYSSYIFPTLYLDVNGDVVLNHNTYAYIYYKNK